MGGSGGVVNSLDVYPASLKSLVCFYFRCVLSSQWKAVTVNLRILHSPKTLLFLFSFFFSLTNSRSSGQPKNGLKDTFFFFSTLRPLFPVVFATATVVAFVLLRNSRFNFLCYTQRGPEVTLRPLATSCAKNYKGYSLVANQLHRASQQGHPLTTSSLAGAGARSRHAGRMFCVLWLPSSPQPHT